MKPPQPKGRPGKNASVTDWGQVAAWYDELVGDEGSEYHRHVVLPGAVRLLKLSAGQRAVDVACGQGVLCRILHRGAVDATGIDAAEPLIDIARQRSDPAIRYIVGDARKLDFLPENHFHAAALILAVQNIHPLGPMMEGISRCLAPGGRLVIVMMHPCFRGPKYSSWGYDAAAKVQYRRVDRYLSPRKEPIVTHPGSDPTQHTWTFHRPVQDYVKALSLAGLLIDALEEWPSHKTSEAGPRGEAENLSRKEIPMFMALRAVKAVANCK